MLMKADHRLVLREAITPQDIVGEALVGVPHDKSPALRAVTDAYAQRIGIDLTPNHLVDNLSMAMSLVASTGGVALMPPLCAQPVAADGDQQTSRRCATSHRFVTRLSRNKCIARVEDGGVPDRRAEVSEIKLSRHQGRRRAVRHACRTGSGVPMIRRG